MNKVFEALYVQYSREKEREQQKSMLLNNFSVDELKKLIEEKEKK